VAVINATGEIEVHCTHLKTAYRAVSWRSQQAAENAVVSRSEDDDKLKFVHSILAAVMSHTMSTLMPMQWHDLRLTGRRRTVDM